ncbi:hypothetical protein J2S98_003597 [Arthrobacter oryzae]|nr:hypothetical protein [Arthrobacter oryzae]
MSPRNVASRAASVKEKYDGGTHHGDPLDGGFGVLREPPK